MTWTLIKRIPEVGMRRIGLGRYVKGAEERPLTPDEREGFPSKVRIRTRTLSLKQAREEARRVLTLISEGKTPDQARAEAARHRATQRTMGSVDELLRDYIAWRTEGSDKRAPATERQLKEWRRMLQRLEERHPDVLGMKARDIEPGHIVTILRPIFHGGLSRPASGRGSKGRRSTNGAQGAADKVQTFLRAAFAYGLESEHSVARRTPRTYGLVSNPVAAIPREAKSTPGTRALSPAELRQFWHTIGDTPKVGPILANLLRFVIASGGQRPLQLAQEPWGSYDIDKRVVSLTDRKGRGGQARTHLVPMSDRMASILEDVREVSGTRTWPWSTNDRAPIDIGSPSSAVRYWLESEHARVDGKPVPPFTPRDLRRTCTQIMQAEGVPDELADRLQSHGVAGVTGTHYRNNPELYLPEKQRALDTFDRALSRILGEKMVGGVLR